MSYTPRRDRMLESEHGKAQPADLSDVLGSYYSYWCLNIDNIIIGVIIQEW